MYGMPCIFFKVSRGRIKRMFLVQTAALLVFILAIAWRFKIRFVESIPVGCCLLVLGLYVLSFTGHLTLSDVLAVMWLIFAAVYVFWIPREKRKKLAGFCAGELLEGGAITAVAMTVIVTICVGGKVVSWWDDYNFWATDVKSLLSGRLCREICQCGGGIWGLSSRNADDEMVVSSFFPEGI